MAKGVAYLSFTHYPLRGLLWKEEKICKKVIISKIYTVLKVTTCDKLRFRDFECFNNGTIILRNLYRRANSVPRTYEGRCLHLYPMDVWSITEIGCFCSQPLLHLFIHYLLIFTQGAPLQWTEQMHITTMTKCVVDYSSWIVITTPIC